MKPPAFVDRFGREWVIEVNVGIIPALADAGLEMNEASAAAVMTADAWTAGRILWAFCAGQAAERKIDHYGFASGLNAAALCSGVDAVVLAVKEFAAWLAIKARLEQEERRRVLDELNELRASLKG